MARKKKLKINGSKIVKFDVSIKSERNNIDNSLVDFIFLRVEADDDIYKYQIGRDATHRDLNFTKNHIESSLGKAISEYLNVEISEDAERNRLSYEVQDFKINIYPGRRL
ncbi:MULTISPECIES: hypothetical protein [Burkholderia cepacia complex]|uniref:hypothetical protein n=1 Tax=Burkholderia cepacia complex TaxID=87882 RepID=UPI0012D8C92B|nr:MULTISPECIES: hypothetical protein [Burkholderia cepacia complex]MDR5660682.1 hypothetical protein [Burkholderia cenocepacia]MDR8093841.1 hypothetical protein [Burkholderia cenocepacia]